MSAATAALLHSISGAATALDNCRCGMLGIARMDDSQHTPGDEEPGWTTDETEPKIRVTTAVMRPVYLRLRHLAVDRSMTLAALVESLIVQSLPAMEQE